MPAPLNKTCVLVSGLPHLLEGVFEAGSLATLATGRRRRLDGLLGAAPVTAVAVATSPVAVVPPPVAIAAAPVVVVTTTITALLGSLLGGQGGALEGLGQLEAHLAAVDLADPHLHGLAFAEIVLDVLDALGAVET